MLKFPIFKTSDKKRLRFTYLVEVHHINILFHSVFVTDHDWKIYIEIYIVEGAGFLLRV